MTDEHLLGIVGIAMALSGLLGAFWGLLPIGVLAAGGLTAFALSRFEEKAGGVFFLGSLVAGLVSMFVLSWGFFIALIIGVILFVFDMKK